MPQPSPHTSLYERLGGEPGVTRLLMDFYGHVLADPELTRFFKDAEMDKLISMQKELFSSALGGPHTYSGRPLREVHAGLGITLRHFQRFREHLLSTLQDAGVAIDDMQEVARRVTGMKREVLG
jgi:hemoglobin